MTARLVSMRVLLVVACVCLCAPRARAFTIESPIADGCHERITTRSVVAAGWGADVPTLPADDAHRRLVGAVPFTVPPEAVADPRVLALLIGVRAPDTEELSLLELDRLATVHGAHGGQHWHCLRESEEDGAAGDAAAIAGCRAEILAELDQALGPGDTVDAGTEAVTVSLSFEGPVTLGLPRYEYRVGRALHALEDSFPHAFRDASGMHVVAVHNWIDWVSRHDYDPLRDGEHHVASRDECGVDDEAVHRAELAQSAATDLLTALADGTGGRAGRLARASTALDTWLTLTPGCNESNAFCAAPDAVVRHGCDASPGTTTLAAPAFFTLLVFSIAAWRRRAARFGIVAVILLALPLGSVRAQERVGSEAAAPIHPPAPPAHFRAWAATAAVGGSFDKGALAFAVGARWFANEDWRFGLDVELAPWIDDPPIRVALGTFDVLASAQWDWARAGSLRFGSRVIAGVSVLLFDVPGASAGDVGPVVGGTIFGLGIDLGGGFEMRLDPEVVVAVPHVVGLPLVYRQYRFTITIAWRP